MILLVVLNISIIDLNLISGVEHIFYCHVELETLFHSNYLSYY